MLVVLDRPNLLECDFVVRVTSVHTDIGVVVMLVIWVVVQGCCWWWWLDGVLTESERPVPVNVAARHYYHFPLKFPNLFVVPPIYFVDALEKWNENVRLVAPVALVPN
jgi:hypothetical protein